MFPHHRITLSAAAGLAVLLTLSMGCDARADGATDHTGSMYPANANDADPHVGEVQAAGRTDGATERTTETNGGAEADSAPKISHAVAVLQPVGDSGVTGEIRFTLEGDQIVVEGEVQNLSEGKHGFHVHQFGDLTAADDGSSAGGHFAPKGHAHGAPDADERHVGDLGNIEADASGNASVDKRDGTISFTGMRSIIGRAVVVHAGADSFKGESGEAGDRVAFGVIGVAEGD